MQTEECLVCVTRTHVRIDVYVGHFRVVDLDVPWVVRKFGEVVKAFFRCANQVICTLLTEHNDITFTREAIDQ